ncbi:MAG: aminodeoxychorismate/anthranilate synthase component II [Patescibacteria group bacterium]|nr:aminodeoxychorismate/anthranilate synthase component II [Patescibacteria group bacterium]
MKILIIDNYDSFTFNLYQYIGEVLKSRGGQFELIVKRNNKITIAEIKKTCFDKIIISPGPGSPDDLAYFGICAQVIKDVGKIVPILGVCLGMQGIAYCFGGKIIRAKIPMHGKTSLVRHNNKDLFDGLPQDLEVMRYHSLIVDSKFIPNCLEITAFARDSGEIMGLRHKKYPIKGVQFHPESFATEGGKEMLKNFLFQ